MLSSKTLRLFVLQSSRLDLSTNVHDHRAAGEIVPFKTRAVGGSACIVLLSGVCVLRCVPVCATFKALLSEMRAQFSIADWTLCSQTGHLLKSDW